ncbi:MAG: hypothetical protein IAE91_14985 [Ignavibacteriaceae bacterium]|nr:hypothetical protein [Ignavibacteriaceae bacterium]
MKTLSFPSVIEANDYELQNAVQNLINGLKIYHNEDGYLVGNLALDEGLAPHKIVNSSPDEVDYQVLAKTSLLLMSQHINSPVTLTVGFPYATYQRNMVKAQEYFKGEHEILHETYSFNRSKKNKVRVEVEKVEVIPEIIGCGLSLRHDRKFGDRFFVASCGYGTFEGGLINSNGIVERTLISTHGMRYAVNLTMRELRKHYNLGLRTEHQFDSSFQQGYIIIDRKRIDITELRKKFVHQYFTEVIAPALRNAWSDDDFLHSSNLVLTGGGAMLDELSSCFRSEFDGVLNVEIADDPLTRAAHGYMIWSSKNSSNIETSVGLDIGNANTVLSYYSE